MVREEVATGCLTRRSFLFTVSLGDVVKKRQCLGATLWLTRLNFWNGRVDGTIDAGVEFNGDNSGRNVGSDGFSRRKIGGRGRKNGSRLNHAGAEIEFIVLLGFGRRLFDSRKDDGRIL